MVELDQQMLSNTAESIILADATGNINDRTPFLVDRSDDECTWQRIPDGNNEWQFVENTRPIESMILTAKARHMIAGILDPMSNALDLQAAPKAWRLG